MRLKLHCAPAQRAAIRAAIGKLRLQPEAQVDFAVGSFEVWLANGPLVAEPRDVSLKRHAQRLEALAVAVDGLLATSTGIAGTAADALNDVKHRRGLPWPPGARGFSFMHRYQFAELFEAAWPQLAAAAREAAAELRASSDPGKVPGPSRNDSLIELAGWCAAIYFLLTGKPPGSGRGESPFTRFVADIFAIGGNDGSAHYAELGRKEWEIRRQK